MKNLKQTDKYYKNIVSLLKIKKSNVNDKFHLICFCKPKFCHSDSLKDFMIELDKNWIKWKWKITNKKRLPHIKICEVSAFQYSKSLI